MLGLPFDARHAAEIGLVTRVVPDDALIATATETAEKLAAKPPVALQACKRLMKRFARERIVEAIKAENEEFAARVRSPEAKEALTAFVNKRRPIFTKPKESAVK
jgi:enoyl-CoA hydratase/carnithine racemase